MVAEKLDNCVFNDARNRSLSKRSCKYILDHSAAHIGQAVVAALEAVGEPGVVQAQQVQQRGVQVVHMDGIGHDVEAEFVGCRRGRGPP